MRLLLVSAGVRGSDLDLNPVPPQLIGVDAAGDVGSSPTVAHERRHPRRPNDFDH